MDFDNLFDQEILEIIQKSFLNSATSLQQGGHSDVGERRLPSDVAERLAKAANARGHSRLSVSPFAVNARTRGYSFTGGKLDDVTVLISQVDVASNDIPSSKL